MTSAGLLTFLILLLGSVGAVTIVFILTIMAIAFIGSPDDLNDVDIEGKPKRK